MIEEWVDIIGYEGKYQVSNTGKVRSLNYNNTGQIKELKQKLNRYGYYEVKLSKNNKTKDFMVGRLVAEHFIDNRNFKDKVIHKKEVTNNSIENLEWAYNSEVMHNQYNTKKRKGKSSKTKITYENKNYKRYIEIAREKGIKDKTFYNRLNNGWSLFEALEIPVGKGAEK